MTRRGLIVVLALWPHVRWPTPGSRLQQLRRKMLRQTVALGVLPHPRQVH